MNRIHRVASTLLLTAVFGSGFVMIEQANASDGSRTIGAMAGRHVAVNSEMTNATADDIAGFGEFSDTAMAENAAVKPAALQTVENSGGRYPIGADSSEDVADANHHPIMGGNSGVGGQHGLSEIGANQMHGIKSTEIAMELNESGKPVAVQGKSGHGKRLLGSLENSTFVASIPHGDDEDIE
jgi:hypothetical protein